jgi:pimeloyl-ACP methyl ester carboxylesterase
MLKKAVCVLCASLLLAAAGYAQNSADIGGDWQGTLAAGTIKLRLVIRIAKADSGWSGKFFSIDQSPDWGAGAPLESIDLQDRNFKFKIPAASISYEGALNSDGVSIAGTFTQGPQRLPLDFRKATKDTEWKDPATHAIQFVTVNRDVKLEVLDWGGTGRPLLLLAGLGNTAHIFDTVAPKLSSSYHVYGMTRRGYGASSVPASGYSADRLADDVLEVIDFLKLNKPVLAGSSIAGEELSSIGSRQPGKVAGLIYLDAGYKYAYYSATASFPPAPTAQQLAVITGTDRAIMDGSQKYTKIQGPVLAIYAFEDKTGKPDQEAQIKAFEDGVPSARVVRIPYANHFVFLSNEAVVLCEINAFISALSSGPAGTRTVPQCTPAPASSSSGGVEGDWQGTLSVGPNSLRVVFHFTKSSDNVYSAAIESLDQGTRFSADTVQVNGETIRVEVTIVRGVFEGTLSADKTTIKGTWTQGAALPLELKRR